MDLLQQAVEESSTVVLAKIASRAYPNGATARCPKCGSVQTMDHDDLVRMMKCGIPRCCSERMMIEPRA